MCPPHAALAIARAVAGRRGLFVDANAVSPATVAGIRAVIEGAGGRFVDGGIVGPPPERAGTTRLFLSGPEAEAVAAAFDGTAVETPVLGRDPGARLGAEDGLRRVDEGHGRAAARDPRDGPGRGRRGRAARRVGALAARRDRALGGGRATPRPARAGGGSREMEEIAATFAAAGQPDGFHRAAAEVYRSQ